LLAQAYALYFTKALVEPPMKASITKMIAEAKASNKTITWQQLPCSQSHGGYWSLLWLNRTMKEGKEALLNVKRHDSIF